MRKSKIRQNEVESRTITKRQCALLSAGYFGHESGADEARIRECPHIILGFVL